MSEALDNIFSSMQVDQNKEKSEENKGNLILLIELHEKIIKRKNELDEKFSQIQSYEQQQNNLKLQLDLLKTELNYLHMNTRHLKSEMQDSLSFTKNCS